MSFFIYRKYYREIILRVTYSKYLYTKNKNTKNTKNIYILRMFGKMYLCSRAFSTVAEYYKYHK